MKSNSFPLFWINILLFLVLQSCLNPGTFLQNRGSIECKYVGFIGYPSKSYAVYEKFREKSSYDDLVRNSKSENLVIRTYSHWALSDKFELKYLKIFEEELKTENKISVRCGCTDRPRTIATSTYMRYLDSKDVEFKEGMEYPLFIASIEEQEVIHQMDSLIVLNIPKDKLALEYALVNREYKSDTLIKNIFHMALNEDLELAMKYIRKHKESKLIRDNIKLLENIDEGELSKIGIDYLKELRNL